MLMNKQHYDVLKHVVEYRKALNQESDFDELRDSLVYYFNVTRGEANDIVTVYLEECK